jgi:hypothetical protein
MPKPVWSRKRIAAAIRAFLIVVLMILSKITNTTQATINVTSIDYLFEIKVLFIEERKAKLLHPIEANRFFVAE